MAFFPRFGTLLLGLLSVTTLVGAPMGYAVNNLLCPGSMSDFSCTTFGIENLGTGAFTPISPVAGFVPQNGGLAWAGGTLYTENTPTNTIYAVNPATGGFTGVGTVNVSATDLSVLGASGGILYELAFPSMNLYSFNPVSGVTTLIGPTGIPAPASDLSNLGQILLTGLGANLYADYYLLDNMGHPIVPDGLYRIDPLTGQATLVGGLSGGGECLLGLGTVNNTLYGFGQSGCSGQPGIYSIDGNTAATTFSSDAAVFPIQSVQDVVPEPGGFVLAGIGFLLLVLRRWRDRYRHERAPGANITFAELHSAN